MKILWILTLSIVIAICILAFCDADPLLIAGVGVLAVCLLVWLWIAAVLPVRKAAIGIELLQSEEFNNRLAPSREPGANRIVKVFNNLMGRLSEERTRLLEVNNLLELLVKASPMGVAIMDFDGKFSLVNDAFTGMAGVSREDILGSAPMGQPGPVMHAISRLKDGEEMTVRAADTEIYRVSRLSFVRQGFRRPFVLTEKLTEEIRRAEKEAYGKVVRTISHEVNNSIGGLRSFLESLTEMENLDADVREVAESCIDGCGSLTEFIRGYADVVRIGEPQRSPMDYNEVILRELPFLRTLVANGIVIETALCPGGPMISADRAMMRQLLVNIVKNSAESIQEAGCRDGRILISSHTEGRSYILEIEDNGKGIAAEDAPLIFNPFHTTKRNGQGIGLTLTSEVLLRHGFRFSLSTVAPRRTVFRIIASIL